MNVVEVSEGAASPIKRSSRTPKLSAKKIAMQEMISEKLYKKIPVDKPSKPKAKATPSTSVSQPSTSKVRKKTSKTFKHIKVPIPVPSEAVPPATLPTPCASKSMYEESPDVDITDFDEGGQLLIDEADSSTSPLPSATASNCASTAASVAPSRSPSVSGMSATQPPFSTTSSVKESSINSSLKKSRKSLKKLEAEEEVQAEEAWLDAIEAGKLEELDNELKSIKDPKLMTARQRAVIEAKQAKVEQMAHVAAVQEAYRKDLIAASQDLSEEMLEQRMLKAQKRKQLAEAKKNKEKKETIDKLLKKTDSRSKVKRGQKAKAPVIPKISFRYNNDGITVSFPKEVMPEALGLDLTPKKFSGYPVAKKCGNEGCQNDKKYNCSTNGIPVCSLQCYNRVRHLPSTTSVQAN